MLRRGFGARRGPSLMRGVARTAVIAGTATAVSGRVQRRQERRDMEAYSEAEAAQAAAAPPAPYGGGGITAEQIDRLKELAELKQAGVLTEVEFEVQKAQILGH